jgi:hypothetical protein
MHDARDHATLGEAFEHLVEQLDLGTRERPVVTARTVGNAEVGVDAFEVERARGQYYVEYFVDVAPVNTHAMHTGIDLQVDAVHTAEGLGARASRARTLE